MLRPKRFAYTLVTQAANSIALAQTPAGAVALTLAGALAAAGVVPDLALGYILLFTTVADESTRTATIVGFDQNDDAQTETALAMPNATTAVSAKFWRRITSITVSGAFTNTVTVGTANTTLSAAGITYALDIYTRDTSIAVDIGGTINYDVKKAFERVTAGVTPNWVAGGLTGQTADASAAYTGPTAAVRLVVNSYTSGATAALQIEQARSY